MDKPIGPKPLEFTPAAPEAENRPETATHRPAAVVSTPPQGNEMAVSAAAAEIEIAGAPAQNQVEPNRNLTSAPAVPQAAAPGAAEQIQAAVEGADSIAEFKAAAEIYNQNN